MELTTFTYGNQSGLLKMSSATERRSRNAYQTSKVPREADMLRCPQPEKDDETIAENSTFRTRSCDGRELLDSKATFFDAFIRQTLLSGVLRVQHWKQPRMYAELTTPMAVARPL